MEHVAKLSEISNAVARKDTEGRNAKVREKREHVKARLHEQFH